MTGACGFQVQVGGGGERRVGLSETCVRRYVSGRHPSSRFRRAARVVVGCAEVTTPAKSKTKDFREEFDKLQDVDSLVRAREILDGMAEDGLLSKWGRQKLSPRPVSQGELKMSTQLDQETLGLTGKSNIDLRLAFYVVVGGSTALALFLSIVLKGELAYFATYLVGGISIAFLAVGSTAPGLLNGIISIISSKLRPDYRRRLLLHEAGHFLAGYLCGIPIATYDVNPVTTAVQFYGFDNLKDDVTGGSITREDINLLSVVALAGAVSEAIEYKTAEGGVADLFLLQALFLRTKPSLASKEQQDQTRWASLMAYTILKKYKKEFDVLVEAMREKKSVEECFLAIESA